MAEVMPRLGVLCVFHQLGNQNIGVEQVNAHRDVHHVRVERRAHLSFRGFLDKAGDLTVAGHLHHAELRDLIGKDRQRSDGDVGA